MSKSGQILGVKISDLGPPFLVITNFAPSTVILAPRELFLRAKYGLIFQGLTTLRRQQGFPPRFGALHELIVGQFFTSYKLCAVNSDLGSISGLQGAKIQSSSWPNSSPFTNFAPSTGFSSKI